MGKHGVDLARIGRQIGLGDALVGIVAGDIGEQLLEVGDVTVDRGAEFRFAIVLPLDLVEGLLPLQRIEATCEDVAFATLIAPPKIDRGVVVDRARNVYRERVQRLDDVARVTAVPCLCNRLAVRGPRPCSCRLFLAGSGA